MSSGRHQRSLIVNLFLLGTFLVSASVAVAADSLPELAEAGHRADVINGLNAGADVNERSVDGTTALHWAVYRKDLELINLLLEKGADPNSHNEYGATPMTTAAVAADFDIVKALIEAGGNVEAPNAEGQTLLMAVARTGNTDTASLLLDHGADVTASENWGGQTALMWAASQQHPQMITLLLAHGADVNRRGKEHDWPRWVTSEPRLKPLQTGGFTPLLYAAREGCADCVKALLDGGADINLPDPWGITPLIMAMLNLHYDTAALLIASGADIDRWDWWGRTALYSAIDLHRIPASRRGDLPSRDKLTALDIARMLLEQGAYPDMRLKKEPPFRSDPGDRGYTDGSPDSRVLNGGATALHKATKEGDVEAVKLLLEYGARVDIPNMVYEVTPILTAAGVWRVYGIFMETPITGAYKTQDEAIAIIDLLLEAGANISDRAANGETVAHGAARAGWNEVLQHVAQLGADLTLQDVAGQTPADLAAAAGFENTAALAASLLAGRTD